jgi:hypothetical protein
MNSLKALTALLILSLSIFAGTVKAEEEMPLNLKVTATVTVDLKVYALALGQTANASTGVLTYQGKKYPFTVTGIGLNKNQIGASHLVAAGDIYNLQDPSQFAGNFFKISSTNIPENGQSTLRNDNKVWMHLKGWANGPITISPDGAVVKFSK